MADRRRWGMAGLSTRVRPQIHGVANSTVRDNFRGLQTHHNNQYVAQETALFVLGTVESPDSSSSSAPHVPRQPLLGVTHFRRYSEAMGNAGQVGGIDK